MTLEEHAAIIKRSWQDFMDCVRMHGTGMTITVSDRSFVSQNMERDIQIKEADLKLRVTL